MIMHPILSSLYAKSFSFLATFALVLLMKQQQHVNFSCPRIIDSKIRKLFRIQIDSKI